MSSTNTASSAEVEEYCNQQNCFRGRCPACVRTNGWTTKTGTAATADSVAMTGEAARTEGGTGNMRCANCGDHFGPHEGLVLRWFGYVYNVCSMRCHRIWSDKLLARKNIGE